MGLNLSVLHILLVLASAQTYNVNVQRLNEEQPCVSSLTSGSSWTYNYNAAFIPLASEPSTALLVRSQNQTSPGETSPSVITLATFVTNGQDFKFEPITEASIELQPESTADNYGTEDPRVVFREDTGIYYMLYSAVECASSSPTSMPTLTPMPTPALGDRKSSQRSYGGQPCEGSVTSRLALATTPTPTISQSWDHHGALFPQLSWSKSGALLIRDDVNSSSPEHYLFFGDSSLVAGLQLATTSDLIHYDLQNNGSVWLPTRTDSWDNLLVEAGPMPMRLSDGNYLFIYNSAYSSSGKQPFESYSAGFVILDKDDPTIILQRSTSPIISPVLDWEVGTQDQLHNTPNVVFVEGWMRVPGGGLNEFYIFYGAADSVVGVANLTVSIS